MLEILFLICSVFDYQGKFGHEAMREVSEMISDIQLTDKTNTLSSKLSGGMKRKLRYIAINVISNHFDSISSTGVI